MSKLFFFIFLLCTIFSCKDKIKYNQAKERLNYSSEIKKISKKWIVYDDLFRFKNFIHFYENPKFYIDSSLFFVEKENNSEIEKHTAIISMQKLAEDDYILFFEKLVNIHNSNKLNMQLIKIAIFPVVPFNPSILKNYQNEKVIKILQSLKNNILEKKDDEYILKILSGQAWKDIKDEY